MWMPSWWHLLSLILECVPYNKTTRVITEQRIQVPNLAPPLQTPLFNSGTLGISKLDDILHPKERWTWVHPPGSSSPIGAAHTIAACLRAPLHAFSASLCSFPFRSSFSLALVRYSAPSHSPRNSTRIECFLDQQGCVTRKNFLSCSFPLSFGVDR